jgi:predicted Zn-dependent protease
MGEKPPKPGLFVFGPVAGKARKLFHYMSITMSIHLHRSLFPKFQLLIVLLGIIASVGLLPVCVNAQVQPFFGSQSNVPAYRKVPEIENQLYGHTYMSHSMAQRIARIERTLFGGSHKGSLGSRVALIEQDMNKKSVQKAMAEQEPLIEYLEEKLFQRTYTNASLLDRVRRLEVQVFGHAFDHYPVSVRIKKLSYSMPLLAKQIRVTQSTPEGDMVVATTRQKSRMVPRAAHKMDVVQLDATTSSTLLSMGQVEPLNAGDYSKSVYREPNGAVIRWENLPIKVFAKGDAAQVGLVSQALQVWQRSFSLLQVEHSSAADVVVTWDKATWTQNTTGLLTRPVVQVDNQHRIRTVILISMFSVQGHPEAHQLHALSHQLGHALGIWGHSDNPNDVMYPALQQEANDFPSQWAWRSPGATRMEQLSGAAEDYAPSQRDINTLLKIYDQPATNLSEYSPY